MFCQRFNEVTGEINVVGEHNARIDLLANADANMDGRPGTREGAGRNDLPSAVDMMRSLAEKKVQMQGRAV